MIEAEVIQGEWINPDAGRVLFGKYARDWIEERPGLRPKARAVRISRQLSEQRGGGFAFGPPKSDAGQRLVAIPEVITSDLASHIVTCAAAGDGGLVFTSPEGAPLRRSNFCRLFCLVADGLVYESVYEAGSGNGSGRDCPRIVDHASPCVDHLAREDGCTIVPDIYRTLAAGALNGSEVRH